MTAARTALVTAALCATTVLLADGGGSSSGASSTTTDPVRRPSVLLVTLDTTRADHLGCYGAAFASTPNLDALARSGTRFDSALSPTPLTLPSHATLMTGLVPRRHGVRDNSRFRLDEDFPVLADRLRDAGYSTAAFVSAAVLDRRLGLARGFRIYDDTVRIGERSAFNYEERAASQTNSAVGARLPELEPPFFLWVHYFDPHLPYVPPEPHHSRFRERPYDGEIAFMDRELGALLSAVRGKDNRLLTVVAGDHGESLGEHGEAAHGVFVYQATQRVPLLVSGPGLPAGNVVRENVGLVDVAPTILDLLGLSPIANADGRSLAPLLRNGRIKSADYEMETFFPFLAYGWAPARALARGSLKYVEVPRPELYDLRADPAESENLLAGKGSGARGLSKALRRLTAGDSLVRPTLDPDLAELRRRIETLGYVGGGGGDAGDAVIDPKDGIEWIEDLERGRRALQLGSPGDGIVPLERLLARNPENLPALLALALCHLRSGNVDRAIALDRRAVKIAPDDDLAHFNLANALAEKGRSDPAARQPALDAYERTLELNPRYADAYMNYASRLMAEGKVSEVKAVLLRARAAEVQDPDIETQIGLLAMAEGNADEARAALLSAVALNSRSARALEALGRIAYANKDFESAAGFYARALESRPSAALAKTLGSIRLHDLRDRTAAREAFRRALELSPPGHPDSATIRELLSKLEAEP